MGQKGFTYNMGTQNKKYLSFLVRYMKPHTVRLLALTALLLGGIGLQLANPQVIRYFIDTAQSPAPQNSLLLAGLAFIGLSLVQRALTLWAVYTSEGLGWSATNALRKDLALHCLRLDMGFHKARTPGELIERIDGDVTALANFFSQFIVRLLGNTLLVVGILVLLFRENLELGVGLTAYTLLILYILGVIQRRAVPIWAAARQAQAEQFGYLEERIGGAEEIRAAGGEEYALYRLVYHMREVMQKSRLGFIAGSLMKNITGLLAAGGYAFGLGVGVFLYTQGRLSLGSAYLIVYYIDMLIFPLQNIREQVQDFQTASASLERIQELFAIQPRVQAPVDPAQLPGGMLAVGFENVTFHYEGAMEVLKDVSFRLETGRILGVLGRTGSGKSTLTRLLFRLYDPSLGSIRLGDVDMRQVGLSELRARVGMVTQDVQLFQASLRDNVTFFQRGIDDAKILRLLTDLQLGEWYRGLHQGLETSLAAGGQGLSAGQAQLLAFLRVFLKDPGLVILDEASSRLDPATETQIEAAIDRLFTGRTGIIIAHRLRSVQRVDDLLILENGRVVEYGRRLDLMADPESRFSHLLQTGLEEVFA
jgi:ATP-binding cassette, subfamily B, bacterial